MKHLLLFLLLFAGIGLNAQLPDTCWNEWEDWKQFFPPEKIRMKKTLVAEKNPADPRGHFRYTYTFDKDGYVHHFTRTSADTTEGLLDTDWFEHNECGQLTKITDSTKFFGWQVSVWIFEHDSAGRLRSVSEHDNCDTGTIRQQIRYHYAATGKPVRLERVSYLQTVPSFTIDFIYRQGRKSEKITRVNTLFGERQVFRILPDGRLVRKTEKRRNSHYDYYANGKIKSIRRKKSAFKKYCADDIYIYDKDGLIQTCRYIGVNYTFNYR